VFRKGKNSSRFCPQPSVLYPQSFAVEDETKDYGLRTTDYGLATYSGGFG